MEERAGKKQKNINNMDIGIGGNRSRVDKRQVVPSQRQGGRKSRGNSKTGGNSKSNVDVLRRLRQKRTARANATSTTPDADTDSRQRERRLCVVCIF